MVRVEENVHNNVVLALSCYIVALVLHFVLMNIGRAE